MRMFVCDTKRSNTVRDASEWNGFVRHINTTTTTPYQQTGAGRTPCPLPATHHTSDHRSSFGLQQAQIIHPQATARVRCLPGLFTAQRPCALELATSLLHISPPTTTVVCTVPSSAGALHRACPLRTHVRAVFRNRARGARPGQRILFRKLNNNLHYTTLYDFKTFINIIVFYCDFHYKQSYTLLLQSEEQFIMKHCFAY